MIHCIVLCLNILRLASRVGIPLWGEGHTEKLARLHFPTWGEITNPGRGECSLNRFGICLSHDSHIGERGHGTSRQYRAIPTYDGWQRIKHVLPGMLRAKPGRAYTPRRRECQGIRLPDGCLKPRQFPTGNYSFRTVVFRDQKALFKRTEVSLADVKES